MIKRFVATLVGLLLAVGPAPAQRSPSPPLVLAAASLQESLTKAALVWTAKGHQQPVLSFAASSALARQIEAGAPADVFISADEEWMNEVQGKGLLRAGSRASFLGNRLVLIAPASSRGNLSIRRGSPLAKALGSGRLAVADPDSVPAGKYAKAALTSLGVWSSVEGKLARGENVRAALLFVERGEVPYGIVYATDARVAKGVRIVGVFPPASHPPISYPLALLNAGRNGPEAAAFRRFLLSGEGKAIFRSYGFAVK
jgi:molybdate transport system substrate-binding protein